MMKDSSNPGIIGEKCFIRSLCPGLSGRLHLHMRPATENKVIKLFHPVEEK